MALCLLDQQLFCLKTSGLKGAVEKSYVLFKIKRAHSLGSMNMLSKFDGNLPIRF